jgi:hypothetical protein
MTEDSPKVPPGPLRPPPETVPTIIEAMTGTIMELDRTLVTLSAAGLGLLVGLLASFADVQDDLWWFWAAAVAFLLAIGCGLAVFGLNARLLHLSLKDLRVAEDSPTFTAVKWFSRGLIFLFIVGALASVRVGYEIARARSAPEPPPTSEVTSGDEAAQARDRDPAR